MNENINSYMEKINNKNLMHRISVYLLHFIHLIKEIHFIERAALECLRKKTQKNEIFFFNKFQRYPHQTVLLEIYIQ